MIDPGVVSIFSAVAEPLVATLLGAGGVAVGIYLAVMALSKAFKVLAALMNDKGVRELTWDNGRIREDRMAGYAAIAQGAVDAAGKEDLMGGHSVYEMDSWVSDDVRSDDQRMSDEYQDSIGEPSYDAEAAAEANAEHDAAASHYLGQWKS